MPQPATILDVAWPKLLRVRLLNLLMHEGIRSLDELRAWWEKKKRRPLRGLGPKGRAAINRALGIDPTGYRWRAVNDFIGSFVYPEHEIPFFDSDEHGRLDISELIPSMADIPDGRTHGPRGHWHIEVEFISEES